MKLFPLMMQQTKSTSGRRAFTLIELVIVLAVASLLFAGLWRLLSGGNATIRDQAAADLQIQITNAIKAYMNSPEGQTRLTAADGSPAGVALGNHIVTVNFPTAGWAAVANCASDPAVVANPTLCNFLPNGFNATTTNSYSQTFLDVNVLKDGTAAGTPANSYSFMVVTTGGDVIPDTSGGRIASNIGNDGGFIYSDTNVCGAPIEQFACGAFGTWDQNITTYNYAPGAGGRIASRTFVNAGTNTSPWLARVNIPTSPLVTPPGTPDFNTLQADTHLGMRNPTDRATFNLQGSAINMQGGTIWGSNPGGAVSGRINLLREIDMGDVGNNNFPGFTLTGPTSGTLGGVPGANRYDTGCATATGSNDCANVMEVAGNASFSGVVSVFSLYAQTFVYETSDIRLKKDIEELKSPAEKLSQLRGVSYKMKDSDKTKFGLIAQEVEKVYPEMIKDMGDGYKGVDYIGMIGPLVGAIKELKQENDTLKETLKKHEAAIEKLLSDKER